MRSFLNYKTISKYRDFSGKDHSSVFYAIIKKQFVDSNRQTVNSKGFSVHIEPSWRNGWLFYKSCDINLLKEQDVISVVYKIKYDNLVIPLVVLVPFVALIGNFDGFLIWMLSLFLFMLFTHYFPMIVWVNHIKKKIDSIFKKKFSFLSEI